MFWYAPSRDAATGVASTCSLSNSLATRVDVSSLDDSEAGESGREDCDDEFVGIL